MNNEDNKPVPDSDIGVAPDPDQPTGVYDLSAEGGENPDDVLKEILNIRGEVEGKSPKKPKLRGIPAPTTQPPAPEVKPDLAEPNWESKYNELNERYLRALADLDNLRKRQQKQMLEQRKYGHEGAIRELLPVLDNLERALQHAPKEPSAEFAKFIEGAQMIVQQFVAALERLGVKPVVALGAPFDPAIHEAIQEAPSADVAVGHIMLEMTKGYLLYDRVLRPAKVIVSAGVAATESNPAPVASSEEPN